MHRLTKQWLEMKWNQWTWDACRHAHGPTCPHYKRRWRVVDRLRGGWRPTAPWPMSAEPIPAEDIKRAQDFLRERGLMP